MPRSVTALSLSILVLVAAGCSNVGDKTNYVQGTLGDVSFDGQPELRDMNYRGDGLELELRIQDERGHWAMVGINVPVDYGRDLSERDFGDFGDSGRDLSAEDLDLEHADMIGCSGEEDDEWEYDCPPSDMSIEVTELENEDGLRVSFAATFEQGDCGDFERPDWPEDRGPRTPPSTTPDPEQPGEVVEGSVDVPF